MKLTGIGYESPAVKMLREIQKSKFLSTTDYQNINRKTEKADALHQRTIHKKDEVQKGYISIDYYA